VSGPKYFAHAPWSVKVAIPAATGNFGIFLVQVLHFDLEEMRNDA